MSSGVFGSWSSAVVERIGLRGREAILQALGSVSAQDERGVRARAAPPRAASPEDSVSPAAACPSNMGPKNTGAGDAGAVAAGAGASPDLSAETALAILVDCFGH